MALSDSRIAVGRVGELLKAQLAARTSVSAVDVGRPQEAAGDGIKLNLFLYRISVDGFMRNQSLDEGQPTPLWLVLHYLLTAYDQSDFSDTTSAHDYLSEGMIALEELNFLRPSVGDYPALADNPEPLKLTFEESDPELLSKLMQGGDDYYRLSVAFQVRPVMVAAGSLPSYAPLVRSVGPEDEGAVVVPGFGPELTAIEPASFVAGDDIEVHGRELGGGIESICLGDHCLGVRSATGDRVRTHIPEDVELSAGSYAVTVRRQLPGGRRMSSNAVLGRLRPSLSSAVASGLTDAGDGHLSGSMTLDGRLLGGEDDDIFVAFYRDGEVVRMLEAEGTTAQTDLTVTIDADDAIPSGEYRIVLRVNGEQAENSPEVSWHE